MNTALNDAPLKTKHLENKDNAYFESSKSLGLSILRTNNQALWVRTVCIGPYTKILSLAKGESIFLNQARSTRPRGHWCSKTGYGYISACALDYSKFIASETVDDWAPASLQDEDFAKFTQH